MTIEALNALTPSEANKQFELCCGASNWVEKMNNNRPFHDKNEVYQQAESIWFSLSSEDWLEAFTHHPKIGNIEIHSNKRPILISEISGNHGGKLSLFFESQLITVDI